MQPSGSGDDNVVIVFKKVFEIFDRIRCATSYGGDAEVRFWENGSRFFSNLCERWVEVSKKTKLKNSDLLSKLSSRRKDQDGCSSGSFRTPEEVFDSRKEEAHSFA